LPKATDAVVDDYLKGYTSIMTIKGYTPIVDNDGAPNIALVDLETMKVLKKNNYKPLQLINICNNK